MVLASYCSPIQSASQIQSRLTGLLGRGTVRAMQELHLKEKASKRIRTGHLWVFKDEIEKVVGGKGMPAGSEALFIGNDGSYLGCGYYNAASPIAGRLLSRNREPDQKELLERRILAALELRARFYGTDDEGCRLVHAEGDFLPGLIIDSYGDYLVIQLLTAGMENRRQSVIDIVQKYLEPKGIVLRNDAPIRQLEELEQQVEVIGPPPPTPLRLRLEGLQFSVSLQGGERTGHFFDQSTNRRLFRTLVPGYKVLDTYCYSGAWGLQAAAGGAKSVTFVDSSNDALELVKANAELNGLQELCAYEQSDVLEFFKTLIKAEKRYDCVVLDPPAFAKEEKSRSSALKSYLHLNREAIRCLHKGGLLVTSSCSYHVSADEFISVVAKAAAQQGRFARILFHGYQSPDHPIPAGLREAAYLKCLFIQVD